MKIKHTVIMKQFFNLTHISFIRAQALIHRGYKWPPTNGIVAVIVPYIDLIIRSPSGSIIRR